MTPTAVRRKQSSQKNSVQPHHSAARRRAVRQMTPHKRSGVLIISVIYPPFTKSSPIPRTAPARRNTPPKTIWMIFPADSLVRASGGGAGGLDATGPVSETGSGTGSGSGSGGALPVTSSSMLTWKISLSRTILSSSGVDASVSHLDTDWRETSRASARSSWDQPRAVRYCKMCSPNVMGVCLSFPFSICKNTRKKGKSPSIALGNRRNQRLRSEKGRVFGLIFQIYAGHCRPVWSMVYSPVSRIWEMGTKV